VQGVRERCLACQRASVCIRASVQIRAFTQRSDIQVSTQRPSIQKEAAGASPVHGLHRNTMDQGRCGKEPRSRAYSVRRRSSSCRALRQRTARCTTAACAPWCAPQVRQHTVRARVHVPQCRLCPASTCCYAGMLACKRHGGMEACWHGGMQVWKDSEDTATRQHERQRGHGNKITCRDSEDTTLWKRRAWA